MKSLYCRHCGKEIADNSRFCSFCGGALDAADSGNAGSGKKSSGKTKWIAIAAAAAVLFFCFGTKDSSAKKDNTTGSISKITEAVKPVKTPEPTSAADYYWSQAESNFKAGYYYKAFDALVSCEDEPIDDETFQNCEDMFVRIEQIVKKNEPVSGKELVRTFQYNGGGELQVKAESGPVEVLVIDVDNRNQYVRFYVRKNETGSVSLPGGKYDVSYKVGYMWFDDNTGFGDYCVEGKLDEVLKFDVSFTPGWVSNSVWTLTI